MVELLLADAAQRCAHDPTFWKMAQDAPAEIEAALRVAFRSEDQQVQQFWHVSVEGPRITGVVHSMMLPVPPIYAGLDGEPGLILADSFAYPDAMPNIAEALIAAAGATLRSAGARILLATFVTGPAWKAALATRGFAPITHYLSRTALEAQETRTGVRLATESDVPGIVARSAEHRDRLLTIDPFWTLHPEADARFDAWMHRSLTLADRDMYVIEGASGLDGYAIAQPATRLHFPPAHSIAGIGVLDDFYHASFSDIDATTQQSDDAFHLLRAAERAFAKRGKNAAFVVCPAGWRSKSQLLQAAGYQIAMVWSIKR